MDDKPAEITDAMREAAMEYLSLLPLKSSAVAVLVICEADPKIVFTKQAQLWMGKARPYVYPDKSEEFKAWEREFMAMKAAPKLLEACQVVYAELPPGCRTDCGSPALLKEAIEEATTRSWRKS